MAKKKINVYKLHNEEQLIKAEKLFRSEDDEDQTPYSSGTSYKELAEIVMPDRDSAWKNPLYISVSKHSAANGVHEVLVRAGNYIDAMKSKVDMDILSIGADIQDGMIVLKVLVRTYGNTAFTMAGFFKILGESAEETEQIDDSNGHLVIPDEIKNFHYSDDEMQRHDAAWKEQKKAFNSCSKEHPFLNSINHFVPKSMPTPEDHMDLIYDLESSDKKINTFMNWEEFNKIFSDIMELVSGTEYYRYKAVMIGDQTQESLMQYIETYLNGRIAKHEFAREDMEAMKKKVHRALFQLYIIQDFVDDPTITDINITAPNAIRVRVKGKSYLSNVNFQSVMDYERFVNGIALKNGISLRVPEQTFTDKSDPNYILRYSITAGYVNADSWPYLHIRKISRKKLLFNDLIEAGMLDEKLRDYLLDCGKHSRGVVFAGPPGSGKTVILNAFLEEAYEQSADILVIQENDELFAYRKGIKFQHPVNYSLDGRQAVSLEDLGKLALVNGSNVFIIGEAKGGEISSAITLSNSGCRTAITIHSPSSTETIDKMADLAMRGFNTNYEQAKRMLKSFQTVVYLENFKIQEISEITGYDEKMHDMTYRYIYRRDA